MALSVDGVGRADDRGRPMAAQTRAALPYFAALGVILALLLAALVGFSLYEFGRLGETQLGIRKAPFYGAYYVGRFLLAALLSGLLAAALYRLRGADSIIDSKRMPSAKRRTAWAMLVFIAICTALFVADARLFNRFSLEDHALEWVSALLPLAASAGFCIAFLRLRRVEECDIRCVVAMALCVLFAFALFIIGMEEISWMQRIFRIATPALFAENQQQEMNLHNMHSIVIGQAYKIVMFVALVLLPFLKDTAPRNRLFDVLSDFLPSRFIFAISAPWVAFNYNEWNFFASQLFVVLTLALLVCYALAAWQRGDRREVMLFNVIAVFILVAQPLYLLLGGRFVRMWDASEYVELFIAFGLTFYTAETMTRLAARYGKSEAWTR
jgi:hypothetical protein